MMHHNYVSARTQELLAQLPSHPQDPDDAELIGWALSETEGLSSYRAAKRLGISDSTVRRWKDARDAGEDFPTMQDGTRDAVLMRWRRAQGAPRVRIVSAEEAGYTPGERVADFLAKHGLRRIVKDMTPRTLLGVVGALYQAGSLEGWPEDDMLALEELRRELVTQTEPGREEGSRGG